jgi:hypothetical protein
VSPDDLLYSPIVPDDQLRELLKRLMQNPTNRKVLDTVCDQIIEFFGRHGITEEQEIVDAVYRKIREIEGEISLKIF